VRLRLAPGSAGLKALQTMLLVAPVELPCTPQEKGPLCDRAAAVFDLTSRFGDEAGRTVAGLQLLCGGSFVAPRAGPTQHCDRTVHEPMVVRAVAGHMHLLGRSISVTLDPGRAGQQTLLDRKVWDFDNQKATPLTTPVRVAPGDTLRVTCTHDASLRSLVPALQEEQPRYVTWGEGTADEMCLGIVLYTRR
jgi:copper type II ascorbate-dependent monooxygenase-like protein